MSGSPFAGKVVLVTGASSGLGLAARAVLFLASSQASYITGIDLPVDGGRVSF